jgi:cysteine-rich repeat protein
MTAGFAGGRLACDAQCALDTSGCVAAVCGDGIIGRNELCDGVDLDGETCESQGFDAGTLGCTNRCAFDTSLCVFFSCGDGAANGGEDCDGADLAGATCETEGFDAGTLGCTAGCVFDTGMCFTEICVDGIDNDGDMTVDCSDASCAAECADACNTVPVVADPSSTSGTTAGHADLYTSSCTTAEGGSSGPETVYQVTAAQTGFLHATLTSATADHGLSAWMGCPGGGAETACEDLDFGVDGVETLSLPVVAGQVVHLLVDGYDDMQEGDYTLDVETVPAAVCGDGFVDGTETCDDGNTTPGDGCNATCDAFCGDMVCNPDEDPCTCATDCPNDANTCAACECGLPFDPAAICQCDPGCIEFGDCCANETAQCGATTVTLALDYAGMSLGITDNGYNGQLASMACASITTPATGTISSVDSVQVTANHPWVGDLTIKVVSPTGTVVTVMSRPGLNEAADDGNGAGGDSSNLGASFPVTFTQSAMVSAEVMGSTIGANAVVCEADMICNYLPADGAAVDGNLTTFAGQSPTGTWQVCIGDGGAGDVGTLVDAVINLTISG